MITKLPEAQSAIDRMRVIATHWDTDKNGQLMGDANAKFQKHEIFMSN